MSKTTDTLTITLRHERGWHGYWQPVCDCGWSGDLYPDRFVEGRGIAVKAAENHAHAHRTGSGYFHYTHGWTSCDEQDATVIK